LRIKLYLVTFSVSFLTASIGGNFTVLDDWYYSLIQPSWKPDDLVFPIAWTIIFTLCAISGGMLLTSASTRSLKLKVTACFLLNAFLNVWWSYLYFFIKRPDMALLEVVFLWGSIIILISFSRTINKVASILLIPYLAWVTLASFLNYETALLNGYL